MFHQEHKTAIIEKECLPLEMSDVPEFFRKKGEEEIYYTPSVREKALKEVKEVIAISDDSIWSIKKFNDENLLLILNYKKYNVEETVLHLKKCLKYRMSACYMYSNIKFEELLPFMTSDVLTLLPWRCQDGCPIGLLKFGNWDSVKHPVVQVKKMILTMYTQVLRYPMTQINGCKIIFDLNVNNNIWQICTPQNVYQLLEGSQKVLPLRFKAYHVVNAGGLGRRILSIVYLFLSQKMKKRVYIHESADKLLDFFPRAILPIQYGGDLQNYDMSEWLKKMTTPEELAHFNIVST